MADASDDLFPGMTQAQPQSEPDNPDAPDKLSGADKAGDNALFPGLKTVQKTYAPQSEDDGQPKSGDAWKAVKAGVQTGIVGPVLAAGRDLAEKNHAENLETIFRNLGVSSKETAEENTAEMSPAARKSMEASFADPEFWANPLRALGYKAANMAPGLAAVGAPALVFSGPVGATIAIAASNAVLAGGSAAKDIYDAIDSKTDADLMQVPFYAHLREQGASEEDARRQYNQEALGNVPLINTIVGAAVGGLGPVAGVARAAKGGAGSLLAAGRSVPGRIAAGATEAGALNAVQGGVENATVQNALVDNGLQQKFDYSQFGKSTADAMAIGVLTGGPLGVLNHGPAKAPPTGERPPVTQPERAGAGVEITAPKTPDTAETEALAASAPKATQNLSAPDVTPEEIQLAGEPHPPAQDVLPAGVTTRPEVAPPAEEPLFPGMTTQKQAPEKAAGALEAPAGSPGIPPEEGVPTEPRAPRVLLAQDKAAKATERLARMAQDAAKPRLVEAEEKVSKGKHYSDEQKEERAQNQADAEEIFNDQKPGEFPRTAAERDTLHKRVTDIVDAATERGIDLKKIKSTDTQSDHMIYLREAYDLKKTLDKKGTPPARRDEHITAFLGRELAAKGGDFSVMRTERKLEGEEKKGKRFKTGDIEQAATPEVTPDITGDVTLKGNENAVGTEDVATAVSKSSKGAPVGIQAETETAKVKTKEGKVTTVERAKAASEGRNIELTPEERAKYETVNLHRGEPANLHEGPTPKDHPGVFFYGDQDKVLAGGFGRGKDRELPANVQTVKVPRSVMDKLADLNNDEVYHKYQPNPNLRDDYSRGSMPRKDNVKALRDNGYLGFKWKNSGGATEHFLLPEALKGLKYEPKEAPGVKPAKERVAEAAKQVERKPTEAQKESGNYAKGHTSIHGIPITIENPRGSVRRGVGPDGKPWQATLPDHYGYIKRTEGADGDHVDVTVGKHPDSKDAFVIDQVDPETKKFDEHKVMMGYKDAVDAMEAYEKSFSDGKGFDRIGKVTPMKVDQLKTWLDKGDTTKPLKASARFTPAQEMLSDYHGKPITEATRTTTAREILKAIDFDKLKVQGSPVSEKLIPFMRDHLVKLIGNTKVHIVDNAQMQKLVHGTMGGEVREGASVSGLHVPSEKGHAHDYIAINKDAHNTPEAFVHTLVHEAIHAVTVRELHHNPEWRTRVELLMYHVRDALGDDVPGYAKYAFTNEKEFLAEAMSNPHFQDLLTQIPLDDYAATLSGLDNKVRPTMWDFFVASIKKLLRKYGVDQPSALEGVLRITKDVVHDQQLRNLRDSIDPTNIVPSRIEEHIEPSPRTTGEVIDRAREVSKDFGTNASGKLRKLKDTLSSTIMLGQRAREFLPGAERVVELRAMMERERHGILAKEGGLDIARSIPEFEREHGSEALRQVADLGFAASEANVNLGPDADNTHLGKDATYGWQAKHRLADLQKDYNRMTPAQQALLQKVGTFFKKVQNDISLQLIKNTLDQLGVHEPGLAERIHTDGLTDADKAKFKTNTAINALNEAREIKQLDGLYIPFRRYGDYVVNSYHEVEAPKGATKIGNDTVQFVGKNGSDTDARNQARDYVADHDLRHTTTKKVWVDKNDPTKRLEAEDIDAVPAYQVKMQRQSTEFFESEAQAKRVQEALLEGQKDLGLEQIDGVRKRSDYVGHSADALSGQMHTVMLALEKQDRFKSMSKDERDAVRQTISEASLRVLGSTRLQSTFLQRRNVAGYSHDIGRVTADYARAATGYLARLRFQPRLDAAFDALKKYIDQHKYESSDRTIRRDELYNELRNRIYNQEPVQDSTFRKVSKRLLQISRLDKLAGVSFHVINAQEPWTTSLPVIGGRHGMVRAGRTLGWAYNLIGARRAMLAGVRDTAAAFVKDNGFTDYLAMFKHEIDTSPAVGGAKRDRLKSVIDYLDARDLYSDGAIFEVSKYSNPSSNIVGRSLDRADLMANQVGSAVEKINRTVTALSAYELEFARNGGNHEAAMHYAYEVTHDTMGDYSSWNSPPAFRSPVGQLALQFRKFALKSYYLLGKTIQGTIAGDREAAKQFIGLMVTHAMVAGALGMPGLEPFKVALLAANALGVTGFTWDDFELAVREKAAELAGAKGGEIISRGAYRAVGLEVSGRLGWDSLLTQPGGPRDPSKVQDVKTYLFDTAAGAPAAYLIDQMKSAQALANGDIMKAIELTVPLKGATDILKAVTGQSSKLDAKGRETRKPYDAYDTAVRALGFTPSSEAENYAKRAQIAGQSRKQSDERAKLVNNWVIAKGADKSQALHALQEWNKTQPQNVRIMPKDLVQAAKARTKNPDGLKETKRNANVFKRLAPIYAE